MDDTLVGKNKSGPRADPCPFGLLQVGYFVQPCRQLSRLLHDGVFCLLGCLDKQVVRRPGCNPMARLTLLHGEPLSDSPGCQPDTKLAEHPSVSDLPDVA